jgi:hypothetical protein
MQTPPIKTGDTFYGIIRAPHLCRYTLHLMILRTIAFVFLFLAGSTCFAQKDGLLRMALSDTSNFQIMDHVLGQPGNFKNFRVLETTVPWNRNRFYIQDLEKIDSTDEHHPYFHSYIFRDPALKQLVPAMQYKSLQARANAVPRRKLQTFAIGKPVVPSFTIAAPGFLVAVSDAVFSNDGTVAFVDLALYHKEFTGAEFNQSVVATVCVLYKKRGTKWEKVKAVSYMIL